MNVVCKENIKCDFVKTCVHSRPHKFDTVCSWKNSHCTENCMCDKEYLPIYESNVIMYDRKEKLKKINETSIL